ncbi:NADH-quinone oxidoreductase subunit NuoK [Terracoccus luteus]|jgi:NADH-quinone oxidoreductase subunit K|nr:NADH-quinone oxidoreductase subunit NuoK [Terracoccus luteus]RKT78848.1 NADH-quinone oxidoreductase subunit K [Terracoccus luteus]
MHLHYPAALAALLAGIGLYGVLARRNAVLVLIGVELVLNAANLLLVTVGSQPGSPLATGPVLTLFVITVAAAEVCIALAIVLVMFRRFGHVDLTAVPDLGDDHGDDDDRDDHDDARDGAGAVTPAAPASPTAATGARP